MSEFLLPPELIEFRGPLREFFETRFPLGATRERVEGEKLGRGGIDRAAWKEIAALGVLGAAIPEQFGGVGFGLRGAAVICEEIGRSLAPLPVSEALLFGVAVLIEAGEGAAAEILPKIASGDLIVSGTLENTFAPYPFPGPALKNSGGSSICTGTADFVPFGGAVDLLLIAAPSSSDGSVPVLISTAEKSVTVSPLDTFDLIRPYTTVTLADSPCRAFPPPIGNGSWLHRSQSAAAVLTSAELLGVARRAFEMILDYAKTRVQFDRPIGSFQAVQHQLADCSLRLEQLESLIRFAAWSADSDDNQFLTTAAAAKAFAGEHIPAVLEKILQLHGGIGFTYEYDLHLFLRRAQVLSRLFGDAAFWQESLAASSIAEPNASTSPG